MRLGLDLGLSLSGGGAASQTAYAGTSAQTLAAITQAASGRIGAGGTSGQILAAITQSVAGRVGASGTSAQTLAAVTQAATGSVTRDYDAATDAVIAAYASPPTQARQNGMDDFVLALKAAGVWTKLDALYFCAVAEDQGSRVNWINPGTYNLAKAGVVATPTFTANQGWAAAVTSYLDTGFNPSTAGSPKYVQDSSSMFVATLTDSNSETSGTRMCGNARAFIDPRSSSGNYNIRPQTTTTTNIGANTGKGLYGFSRTGASLADAYKNGAIVSSPNTTSQTVSNEVFHLLTHDGAALTGKVVSMFCFGSGLNSTEADAIWDAYVALMGVIGTSPT